MPSVKINTGKYINIGRSLRQVLKFCQYCNAQKHHNEHKNEDDKNDEKTYHFCIDCGKHN